MILLLATQNSDKLAEMREILAGLDIELLSASEIPNLPKVKENHRTIEKNAGYKATETASFSDYYTLADDTGLFVSALAGAPGVHTARYAGENCTYSDNRQKLLRVMQGMWNRQAEFRTCVALAGPHGKLFKTCLGIVKGEITESEKGDQGFGYDSIFYCPELQKTFAEMNSAEKHQISHRGRALQQMIPYLQKISKEGYVHGKSKNF